MLLILESFYSISESWNESKRRKEVAAYFMYLSAMKCINKKSNYFNLCWGWTAKRKLVINSDYVLMRIRWAVCLPKTVQEEKRCGGIKETFFVRFHLLCFVREMSTHTSLK